MVDQRRRKAVKERDTQRGLNGIKYVQEIGTSAFGQQDAFAFAFANHTSVAAGVYFAFDFAVFVP